LAAHVEKTILSEKMIEEDLSWVEQSATKSTYKLGIGFERCEDNGEKSALKFIPSSTYHKEEATIKPTKAHYPSFNPKREVRKKPPSRERKLLFASFVAVRVTWMSFASGARGLRGGALIVPKTHIVMSFLIICLTLSLTLCLTLRLVLFLSSLMDLTIAHLVLVHEGTTLSLDALVTAHILIVVIVSHVGLFFLMESPTPTLSRDTWMVHIFPIVVHVPLSQVVRCKGL
jgi:hypothetical protein